MKNLYLFQPQYSVEIRNEDTYWLPYSVGCIWSYCIQFKEIVDNFNLKDIIFRREHPDKIIEKLDNPALCGFSCYVWNEQYCLKVAKLIKNKFPNCVIEFGGPQATKKLLEYDFIDSIIISEGEESFLDLLKSIHTGSPIEKIYEKNRIEKLDFPSPYQTGVFDKIIDENPNVLWAMTMETNRGCPHLCTYCDWGGLTYSKVRQFNLDRVKADIEWVADHNVGFIFNADANFGMYKERDIEIAKLFRSAADRGKLEAINIQYAKNSTEVVFEIAKILGDISRGVTISVQSMNEPTLKAIKRKNLSVNNIASHIQKSREYGVKTYTELILGLPDETLDSWKDGFSKILECGQHESIDIWFCQLFGNTELNGEFSRNLYCIKTIKAEDYVSFANDKDYDGVVEIIELISETNSMTNDELIQAYMYGWMIVQFHIAGYSQLLAKYCFNTMNISYRTFYDNLFDYIAKNTEMIGEHYREIFNAVNHYMKTGKILNKGKHGHTLHAGSFNFMFNNKDYIFSEIENCVLEYLKIHQNIFDLQRNFIFSEDKTYPLQIESQYDVETWEKKNLKYQIDNEFKNEDKSNLFILRRKGLLKNKIIEIK
jgi:hypothetical protein